MPSLSQTPAGDQAAPASALLNLHDPEAIRGWLALVQSAADDAIGAAEDQVRPLDERNLGRVQARRILGEARGSLERLLALMHASLPAQP
jgi:hypothetical protein